MRQSVALLKHVPLIKFVGGPHPHSAPSSKPQPHPCAPNGRLPQAVASTASAPLKPIELKDGEVLLRNELSKRFRYRAPSATEVEQIDSGGAELVY
ncbi:hypothetical protein ACI3LY_004847 [Candidozyma auris]|uniref:Uncharacterized protein n=1 Tax=Candidozyma auris TaxID=498019 RepID=A0A2H0ZVW4_CANAR|nr:hypothetical_protein [[Candida] auris]PIS54771.1 hypothetical protein B9J08_002551 [[Candida] auris]PIS55397.1 hypothetical protein CJI97_002096 [[Candida] auris]PSK77103.1 hypothetical protein CJJ07_003070 [[Candida] auris]QEL63444.1 hypothetical protein CJJ09_005646 [[Candida] auris]QEO24182.1 hypothetical_protein [[Candida] auris]